MTKSIRIAAQIQPGGAADYLSWRSAVLDAEAIGADIIFGYDHFHKPAVEGIVDNRPVLAADQPDVNNFEGWTALASWGEITTTAEIGLLVTGVGFRNPDLLADMARTVDHISGGRLILGLGSGWYEKDYTTYGYDYGTTTSRLDLFDAGVERIERRLTQLVPPPVRRIPILIGGAGEKRSLPSVARYADIWHSFPFPIDVYRRKSKLLDELATAAGRDGADIERSVASSPPFSTGFNRRTADKFVEAGVTLFTVEIAPSHAGYDLTELEQVVSWRDTLATLHEHGAGVEQVKAPALHILL
jgi:probable F420-dependent oxidoreductase